MTSQGRQYPDGPLEPPPGGELGQRIERIIGYGSVSFFPGAPHPQAALRGQHVEITADFCQCPVCREARCEP